MIEFGATARVCSLNRLKSTGLPFFASYGFVAEDSNVNTQTAVRTAREFQCHYEECRQSLLELASPGEHCNPFKAIDCCYDRLQKARGENPFADCDDGGLVNVFTETDRAYRVLSKAFEDYSGVADDLTLSAKWQRIWQHNRWHESQTNVYSETPDIRKQRSSMINRLRTSTQLNKLNSYKT